MRGPSSGRWRRLDRRTKEIPQHPGREVLDRDAALSVGPALAELPHQGDGEITREAAGSQGGELEGEELLGPVRVQGLQGGVNLVELA